MKHQKGRPHVETAKGIEGASEIPSLSLENFNDKERVRRLCVQNCRTDVIFAVKEGFER